MRLYIEQHMDQLEKYCNSKIISLEKLMTLPKCYNKIVLHFQWFDESDPKTKLGLMDSEPAKVLMTVRKKGDVLEIESVPDINEYLK